jgi:hypothetical protein
MDEASEAALDAAPRAKAQHRWWLSQERQWLTWNERKRRHGAGNPNFTVGNRERDKQWPEITPGQLAAVKKLIKDADGKRVTAAEVTAATGLGAYRARQLLHQHGIRQLTELELVEAVVEMMNEHGRVVRPADVMALGVSRDRAVAAIETAGGTVAGRRAAPDLSLLVPDDQGLVRGSAVAKAYKITPGAVTRLVERRTLNRAGGEGGKGRPLLLNLEEVREKLG